MALVKLININSFLELSARMPVLDVRSPGEYQHAHIPGAFNLHLFDNDERALIGTLYNKKGQQEAILKGIEIAGGKTRSLAEAALKIAGNKQVLIHCWRGGMRSESVGWLLERVGMDCYILKGGYKSYRQNIRKYFGKKFNFCVLGGMTGCGKTEILGVLKDLGHQVIDLEKIAGHKGSVFGALGKPEQKSNEQFENELFKELYHLDSSKPVWIEDESRNLGQNIIPPELFKSISGSPVIVINIDTSLRIQNLMHEYSSFSKDDLKNCLNRISRRIGGANMKMASEALENDKLRLFTEIILSYYDASYFYALGKKPKMNVYHLSCQDADPGKNAMAVLGFVSANSIC
jgi:tRNA 2-selenouridine synthase